MPLNKRGLIALICVASAAAAGAGCGGDDDDAGAPASGASGQQRQSVTLGYFPSAPTSALPVLAEQRGLFQKHGIDVKLLPYNSGPAAVSLLLSGDADYVTGAPPPIMAGAVSKGACLQYLTRDQGNVIDIIARPDLKLPNAGKPYPQPLVDLKGKKVGVLARGAAAEAYIKAVLQEAGLNPDEDVTFVAVGPPPTAATALKQKQVDAVYLAPPMGSILGPDGYQLVAKLVGEKGHALENLMQAGTLTSCKRTEGNPDQAKRFCSAIWDAYEFAQAPENDAAMGQFFTEFLKLQPAAGKQLWAEYKSTFDPKLTPEVWQAQEKFLPEGTKLPDYAKGVFEPCAASNPTSQ